MSILEVFVPSNLQELQECLKRANENTYLISGGTDLIIKLKENPQIDVNLIDLSGVEELKYIKVEGNTVKIGSRATFTQISENEDIIKYGLCLAQAASGVGSKQIRNRGTIGGNIGNSSPAGDTIPALCALGADVTVMDGQGGFEIIPAADIITGIGKNRIGYGRVITEISFPIRDDNYISAFHKIGSRSTVTIARLNMAVLIKYHRSNNSIMEANAALGALGTKVICSNSINNLLCGRSVDETLREELAEALTEEVDKAIPGRASQKYKRHAIRGLAYDIWEKLFNEDTLGRKGEI